jgi:type III pantothenate kinase
MLFVIDVGNTHTVLGVFDDRQLVEHWRIQTHRGRTADEHGTLLRDLFESAGLDWAELDAAVMSCVVPPMEHALQGTVERYLSQPLRVVGRDMHASIPVEIPNHSEVGADRLVNATAAVEDHVGAQVIVDFGTATTFDAISAEGAYVGGAIAPGMHISSDALFRTASKLPRVELDRPASVIGTDTVTSMQSGLMYGYQGLVREIVEEMTRELGGEARVVATGGLARQVAGGSDVVDRIDEWLTLRGLRILHEGSQD